MKNYEEHTTIVTNVNDVVKFYNKYDIIAMEIVKGIGNENVAKITWKYRHDDK